MAAAREPVLELDIQLVTDPSELPAGADFETWIRAALEGAARNGADPVADCAISLRLVGLEEGAQLNSTWRHKPGPTNVLAFPGPRPPTDGPTDGLPGPMPIEYGDLVICLPVVAREAAEQGKDSGRHLAHLIIHGTLHLLGYTHDREADAAQMEALETRILGGLGIPDPYVST